MCLTIIAYTTHRVCLSTRRNKRNEPHVTPFPRPPIAECALRSTKVSVLHLVLELHPQRFRCDFPSDAPVRADGQWFSEAVFPGRAIFWLGLHAKGPGSGPRRHQIPRGVPLTGGHERLATTPGFQWPPRSAGGVGQTTEASGFPSRAVATLSGRPTRETAVRVSVESCARLGGAFFAFRETSDAEMRRSSTTSPESQPRELWRALPAEPTL